MFDFEPTEEQRALIETTRRFTRERIIPVAAECDREAKFPMAVFQEGHRLGLVNPTVPETYGGPGLSGRRLGGSSPRSWRTGAAGSRRASRPTRWA